ncbi:MAG: sigma-54-dependent Fis family transcriptional regulator [Planctomycetes bacterium]|nr:sigma-54-dependent Fis family transcriptional regulator [Planctomycetota bacterium]
MKSIRLLIVDDEGDMLDVCRDMLTDLPDLKIQIESNPVKAAERLRSKSFDLLITDLKMPGLSGLELVRTMNEIDPTLLTIFITAYPTEETAVDSIKLGVVDYLVKPFSPEQLKTTVKRAMNRKLLMKENLFLTRQIEKSYRLDELVGQSAVMQKIYDIIQLTAPTDADVLVTGESGTGKEMVARSIHKKSKRADKRFVPVDCGAIPETLFESELFGHEKGSYTGAVSSQVGLLEFADGGTIFLDEVCELPVSVQSKLLRAIQERSFRPVGATEEVRSDIRVVAATNRDIEKEVKDKHFREDLYYRINVVRIDIPPLREREKDIELFAKYFLTRYSQEMNKGVREIDSRAMEIFNYYFWPGNIRELQNVIKRAIILTRNNIIGINDLPDSIVNYIKEGDSTADSIVNFFQLREQYMAKFEQEYLLRLLTHCDGDVTMASKKLKLPRGTLYRLLNKHNIVPDDIRNQ